MIDSGSVECKIQDGVGTIVFSHPRSNSLPGALLRQLATLVGQLGNDEQVRVVILKSSGEKAFCAGVSFDELLAVKNLEDSKYFFSGFALLTLAMKQCPKFIITRVQGKAVGGGVGVVAASDYVFAHESASIRLSELALGIGPFIIGPAVQRKIGTSHFSAMAIDADWRTAAWAQERGLYTAVVSTHDELDKKVAECAKQLATFNPEAMTKLKAVLWEGTEDWKVLLDTRANITSKLALTPFVQAAITAVNNK